MTDIYVRDEFMGNGSGGYRKTTIGEVVAETTTSLEAVVGFRDRLLKACREAGVRIHDDGTEVTVTLPITSMDRLLMNGEGKEVSVFEERDGYSYEIILDGKGAYRRGARRKLPD